MRFLGRFLRFIILGVNLLFALLMIFVAYSPYLDPEEYPVLSNAGLTFPVFLVINICFFVFWLLIYWRFFLLPLLTFLICINQIRTYFPINIQSRQPAEKSIKFLSYNCMAFDGSKKHTAQKPNPILSYIQQSGADIICMQEFIMGKDKHHLEKNDVDNALSAYPYHVFHQVGKEKSNGLACYSKFPILSAEKLDYTSQYNGSAIYEIVVNGDTVVVINNHLESNKLTMEDKKTYVEMIKSPEKEKVSSGARLLINKLSEASQIRAQQAKYISEIIDSLSHRTIVVCGDFNDNPISFTHRTISKELNDAFVQSGNGVGISYNQNGFYFRIDNILLSKNLKARNCTVDRSIKDSDHYPIWCYIEREEE